MSEIARRTGVSGTRRSPAVCSTIVVPAQIDTLREAGSTIQTCVLHLQKVAHTLPRSQHSVFRREYFYAKQRRLRHDLLSGSALTQDTNIGNPESARAHLYPQLGTCGDVGGVFRQAKQISKSHLKIGVIAFPQIPLPYLPST